jgi:hypothetical protein
MASSFTMLGRVDSSLRLPHSFGSRLPGSPESLFMFTMWIAQQTRPQNAAYQVSQPSSFLVSPDFPYFDDDLKKYVLIADQD